MKHLFKSTTLVSSMTMISRVLGFIRDMIAAQIFGASASVDAFYIAFKIPNFMRNLFAEGSFSQAFVPVLCEYRQKKTPTQVKHFINHIAGLLGLVLLLITILGVFASPVLVSITAPGLDPFRFAMATDMLRVTFPYLMLISLTAFSSSILNSYGAFGIPSFTPALLNITLILTAWFLSPYLGIPVASQAYGVLIAGVVQLFFQLPFLYRLGFLPIPKLNWQDEGVRRVLTLMLPSLFGSSIGQISLLINTIFASFLAVGSVTWLYYSERLAYFPLGVFGVALATVVLPHLSRRHADKNPHEFTKALDWGIRCNLIIGLPATLFLALAGIPILATLFQYGRFSVHDILMTQQSLLAYSLGLQAFMLVKVLSASFFATQNVRTPVRIGLIVMLLNFILNAIFIGPLAHAGLALATSICAWINVSLLFFKLRRKGIYRFQKGWGIFLMRLLAANIILAIFLYWRVGDNAVWLLANWQQRISHLVLLFLLAPVIYLLCLRLGGMRLSHFRSHEEYLE